jgi:anaerobic dimethyl sulfoxide reductase subunit C (anchor subunit)
MTGEWALVLFTLLCQAGVGVFVISEGLGRIGRDRPGSQMGRGLAEQARILALILTGLGLIAAFFHLGSPERSVFVLSNTGSSWISREILAGLLFTGCLAALVGMDRIRGPARPVQGGVSVAASEPASFFACPGSTCSPRSLPGTPPSH